MKNKNQISDKHALQVWISYRDNLLKATTFDNTETTDQQLKRIADLEANPEAWFKYYFPNYCTAEPAAFHKKATKRWLANDRWYEVRAWSRELAKSARAMMEDLYLLLTKKSKLKIIVSGSYEQAEKLFMPYMINLESNQRIIHDYGRQRKTGFWNKGDITSRMGFGIYAIGAGQNPRGGRKDEARPDIIDIDDIDNDEETRNPERIKEKWNWIEKALIPTMSISGKRRIRFNGNIIAKYCCITEAMKIAKHVDVINIRDKNGKSSWIEKNSEQQIDEVLSEISYMAAQGEYFNNPMTSGEVFKEVTFVKLPPIHTCDAVLVYADPATSNKDKSNGASTKFAGVIGRKGNKYFIYKCWLDQASNAKFIDWLYGAYIYLNNKKVDIKKFYLENNTLQDPFYEQVLLPLIFEQSKQYNLVLPITPDSRKKPDKFFRIEGTLEPLNRLGLLQFNIEEESDPHMKRLHDQFLGVSIKSKTMDGPDGVEGGVWILQHNYGNIGNNMHFVKRKANDKKF